MAIEPISITVGNHAGHDLSHVSDTDNDVTYAVDGPGA